MLDEALDILAAAWSGEPVHHLGHHYTIDGIEFLPRPVQRPGVPVWAAGGGATWWLPELAPEEVSVDQVRGVLRDGPLAR